MGLGAEDPALRRLLDGLVADLLPGTGDPDACDVRLVGPAELAADGVRGLRRRRMRPQRGPLLVIVPDDASRELVRECFRAGAQDVLALGEAPHCLVPAIWRAFERADSRADLPGETGEVAAELGRRARQIESALQQLQHSYDQTLEALVSALDLREQETADHSLRVALYALRLALRLGVPEASLRDLYHGALLHDIGKIGIPDYVLLKPGRLSEAEWQIMRTHARLGGDMLGAISFLSAACDVPLSHHEAWDGSGYPMGTAGAEIPLHARIFAVVDTYDALRSERPYKRAHSHAESVPLLVEAAGSRLDPAIVERFAQEPAESWEQLAASAPRERGFAGAVAAARSLPG